MRKFRKKPVVIEAVQVTNEWLAGAFSEHMDGPVQISLLGRCAWINTLEGRMKASVGDWIITGVKGERYPIKDDIFRMTYEEVQDA